MRSLSAHVPTNPTTRAPCAQLIVLESPPNALLPFPLLLSRHVITSGHWVSRSHVEPSKKWYPRLMTWYIAVSALHHWAEVAPLHSLGSVASVSQLECVAG